ncbi:MAG TPA: thrombospondin type 3 repeat-containing protein, partial [Poseidonia sp.]|nr:thrombospondin type 3 repeat-containing protein [Poseidonia sp.]
YDGDWYANSSMRTYFIDDDGSLELALSPQIVNTSIGIPIFFPQQTSFITYVDDFNDYHEEGYYLWSPDSDGDGIGDTSDLCPGTNLNEFSDEDGCSWEQLDDDEDGIFNGQDLCTGTMYQALIDENGCSDAQVDKDSDGVCDQGALSVGPSGCQGIDLCPNTLPGNVANAAGCSWGQQDEDDDDVPNGVDVCPDTGQDDDANADGCGEKQRDSDSDLLNDYWDQCPLTASNSSVDEIGCSDLQVDADLDSVCDSGSPSAGPSNCTGIDICPETGENQTVNADGCSWNQTDDDGDGIRNMDDSCPDTIEAEISPDGCSSWQRDSDDDGISDALDKCAKTPENEFSNQEGCSQSQGQSEVKSDGSDLFSGATLVLIGAFVLGLMVLSGFFLRSRNEPELLQQSANQDPPYQTRGAMRDDGKEWIEFPEGSGNMYYRDSTSGQWVKDQ